MKKRNYPTDRKHHRCPNCNYEIKYKTLYKPCAYCKKDYEHNKNYNPSKYCSRECTTTSRRLTDEELKDSVRKRFYSKFIAGIIDECWEWKAYKNKSGYGVMRYGSKRGNNALAHRISYLLNMGEIPSGLFVMHTCDNPPCVNPSHLRLGTNQDNVDDMVNKGRHYAKYLKGQSNLSRAIITANIARNVKIDLTNNIKAKEIADKYAISKHIVWDIKREKTWKHITIKD